MNRYLVEVDICKQAYAVDVAIVYIEASSPEEAKQKCFDMYGEEYMTVHELKEEGKVTHIYYYE